MSNLIKYYLSIVSKQLTKITISINYNSFISLIRKGIMCISLCSFILMNITACGTMKNIITPYRNVKIASSPSGANYMIYNRSGRAINKEAYTTPNTIDWQDNYDHVRFELSGFPSQTARLKKNALNKWMWGNIWLNGLIGSAAFLGSVTPGSETGREGEVWSEEDAKRNNKRILKFAIYTYIAGGVGLVIDLLTGNFLTYSDNITVDMNQRQVTRGNTARLTQNSRQGIEYVLPDALQQIISRVVKNSTIVVSPISTTNMTLKDYITGEMEYLLVNQGFNVVDRASLDRIRTEQRMQTSGEIDDRTAVSIGRFLGANYIITGRIVTTDMTRLRLQVLDVQTADVLGSSIVPVGESILIPNPIGIEDAIPLAISEATSKVTRNSRLAIVDVSANPYNDFIRGESEFLLINQGFKVIDRTQLDNIRRELAIQYSGEVDDNTAVSIGKFAGADYIISIRTDGQGGLSRFRWRILDTQTAKVAGGASIHFEGISSKSGVSSLKEALERAIEQVTPRVTKDSRIAIIQISAISSIDREYIFNESEFVLVNKGYRVVDRSQLDRIRAEQSYQLSGEVDDRTAVAIGKFAGARYIMTGSINGSDSLRRLRLRIVDTQTAEVVGVSSVRF